MKASILNEKIQILPVDKDDTNKEDNESDRNFQADYP